ncbi:uncharacterized protein LOC135461455 [Liolophura sinensis]|uniref:uncharacterized protein LOC135461455 n=1 Tax=Liolophura sinensis TaxID=3198878 RepID=UPI0031582973
MSGMNAKGFFDQLRQLSKDIGSNIDTLKARIECPARTDYASNAVIKLQEMRKEMKTLKADSEVVLENCRKKTADFGDVLAACQQLVQSHKTTTLALESFLKQYGYTTWDELKSKEAESQQKKEEVPNEANSEQANDSSVTSVQTPESKSSRRGKGTPKLEDYVFSEYTMHARSQWMNKDVKTATNLSLALAERQAPQSESSEPARPKTADVPETTSRNVYSDSVRTPLCRGDVPHYGTPKLEEFEFSEHTMQLINILKTGKDAVVENTPLALKQGAYSEFGYDSPQQPVPAKFMNDGVLVTPSIGNGQPYPTETPAYHIGGAYGFGTQESPYQTIERSRQENTFRRDQTAIKLEDHLDFTEDLSLPQPPIRRLDNELVGKMPSKPTLLTSEAGQIARPTPPEPQLLSSRLQRLQIASSKSYLDSTPPEPELLTVRLNTMQVGQRVNLLNTKLDNPAPQRLEQLSQRLTKQKEAVSHIIMASHMEKTVPGLPKPLDERAYPMSAMPAPPKLLGKYDFLDSENVPP